MSAPPQSIIRSLFAFGLFLVLGGSTSKAAGLEGSWAGTFLAPGSLSAIRLSITSANQFADSKMIVNVYGTETTFPIQKLLVDGDAVSFSVEMFKEELRFKGKLSADSLAGSVETASGGIGEWRVRRFDDSVLSRQAKPLVPNGNPGLPKPTGTFPIGRRSFYWTDETRSETITPHEADKRKLFVQLWYPAKRNSNNPSAAYIPDLEELHANNPNLSILRIIQTHARENLAMAQSKAGFPVIVFSPGLGTNIYKYTAIIEKLASHGFVVAAINHAYDAGDFKFSDGQTIRYAVQFWDQSVSASWTEETRRRFFNERRKGWADDISFLINRLTIMNGEGWSRKGMDLNNIGILGHSFGGQAATIACAEDTRLKACANMDGLAQGAAFLPNSKGENLKQPFMFFFKLQVATDSELTIMGLTRSEYDQREQKRMLERWKPSLKTRLANREGGTHFVVFRGATHQSFSDGPLLEANPKDETLVDRQRRAMIINEYILAFFDKFLRRKESPLFDPQNQPHAEVVFELLRK